MFSHLLENGIHCCLLLTPSNRVLLRLTYSQRIYSLDITDTAHGQVLLGVPVKKLDLATDMARIGRFWRALNDHVVTVNQYGNYHVACPSTKGFTTHVAPLPRPPWPMLGREWSACHQCLSLRT